MKERDALIALCAVEGLTGKAILKLLAECGEAAALWEEPEAARELVSERQAQALLQAEPQALLERTLQGLEKAGAEAVTWAEEEYPARLRDAEDAPPVVYRKGRLPQANARSVAIVGSRRATADGLITARRFGEAMADAGVAVVSGMAMGIDGASQEGSTDRGGRTVAVLGCAIDVCYPPEHRDLMDRILETGGCVLSEHPPGRRTYPHHFSERNRLVTALSDALLVVEAGEKSGALISAACAKAQGRPLFCVPGSVMSHACLGSNALLREGARAVLCPEDLLKDMDWLPEEGTAGPVRARAQMPQLDPLSASVVEYLKNEERSFGEIVNHLQIDVTKLNSLLTILEMQGIIRQSAGKLYRAVL